ncbi:CDP-diacylglycerol--serine O-phosphatidyltransferase 2 [Cyclospora cayetanensis]|uniref:CDP-diacylglycerol--serine O-phosphatidyltransferase 2 n=1 Tax=Cyclospora cayetanensis TaxID=88456 RepID=A0A6P6RX91_9EIME|nr:CDP-diacylglycerol--serine O-phosphatidyltransferase 2 [Cyclospora cayetanensis]
MEAQKSGSHEEASSWNFTESRTSLPPPRRVQLRDAGIQTSVPSREYVGPRVRASQAPEFLKEGWLHRPKTVSSLCGALLLIFVAAQIHSQQNSSRRVRLLSGALASLLIFLLFGTLQLPDGLLVRPSPIIWRFVKSCSIVYLVGIIFLLFQNLADVRAGLHWLDPSTGIPLEERNYAEGCNSWAAVLDKLDIFVLAHFFGWLVKAMVIRDTWLLWILSVLFEWMEISFRHILPNFWECWWDHVLLDILGCNFLGICAGLFLCRRFQMLQYQWHANYEGRLLALSNSASLSFSVRNAPLPASDSPATGSNCAVYPADTHEGEYPVTAFCAATAAAASSSPTCNSPRGSAKQGCRGNKTAYHWPSMLKSVKCFVGIVFFCLAVTLLDLNVFFLKAELYIGNSHWIILARTTLFAFAAAAGTREFYAYLTDSECPRMGLQCWLDLAMLSAEALLAFKYYSSEKALQPHPPCPTWILICWCLAAFLVVAATCCIALAPQKCAEAESEASPCASTSLDTREGPPHKGQPEGRKDRILEKKALFARTAFASTAQQSTNTLTLIVLCPVWRHKPLRWASRPRGCHELERQP